MTIPLWCLFIAVFIPYIISFIGAYYRSKIADGFDNRNPRLQASLLEGAGARAYAAQSNAWEALGVFTVAVLINHLTNGEPNASGIAAIVFIVFRFIHFIAYIRDIHVLRSLSFFVGTSSCLYLIYLGANSPL